MKKFCIAMVCIIGCILLNACASEAEDKAYLKEQGITSVKSCSNLEALKQNKNTLRKDKVTIYCDIDSSAKYLNQITSFIDKGYQANRISEFLKLPYYRIENTNRYISYDDRKKAVKDIVRDVNIGLDHKFYTHVETIKDLTDTQMLVNKYHKLPDGYVPKDMVHVDSVCDMNKDNGCTITDIEVRKEVAEAFSQFVAAAKKEGFQLKAISGFRGYNYQKSLYDTNRDLYGAEYADSYFTRPSFSEHNTGLTLDVTIDHHDYTELQSNPHYDWFMKHLADYGFILRYPKEFEKITGISYESWHIRYVGKETAKVINKRHISFEEYIATLPNIDKE